MTDPPAATPARRAELADDGVRARDGEPGAEDPSQPAVHRVAVNHLSEGVAYTPHSRARVSSARVTGQATVCVAPLAEGVWRAH